MAIPAIEIRNAGPTDIKDMICILQQLFAIEDDFTFDADKHHKGLCLMLEGCGKHRVVKVAVKDSRVVGMCTAQTRISTATGEICAVLEDLVVDEALRGQGIGQALLENIYTWAGKRGIRQLQLLADKNNTAAHSFYHRQQWQTTQLICLTRINPGIS